MEDLYHIGFTSHVHFFEYEGNPIPIEIGFCHIPSGAAYLFTVNHTIYKFNNNDSYYNEIISWNKSKIEFPSSKGRDPLEIVKKYILNVYFCCDNYRFLKVAVNGIETKNFFLNLGIPAVDYEQDLKLLPPLESEFKLDPYPAAINHAEYFHICGNDRYCSLRLAYYYRNYVYDHQHTWLLRRQCSDYGLFSTH
ncbi:hypothetical protein AVEN_200973-1 [Araneus ventricosus]|uniref:Uncharacterized protein n=1 Tax=Araneus ventricosus TaxID=182803 RepID=A0A4Y2TMR0_ARAVE|nr:hypothetical protein AVEN_200973-1 [Araneus ventricosus]